MSRTHYRASEGKHLQQPTMTYNHTLTSSSVNHLSHQRNALFLSYLNLNDLKSAMPKVIANNSNQHGRRKVRQSTNAANGIGRRCTSPRRVSDNTAISNRCSPPNL